MTHRAIRTQSESKMNTNAAIYLFRHGETEWNAQRRRQGQLDSPLTKRGRLQAAKNAKRLCDVRALDGDLAVFVSPTGRAKHTALIMLNELGISEALVTYEPRLMECCFGVWEGLTNKEIEERYPEEWRARSLDPWNVPAPSGESYGDVHARVSEWYAEAALVDINLVVCHGLTSRVLRGIHSGLSSKQVFELDEPQDGFYELKMNDSSYVK